MTAQVQTTPAERQAKIDELIHEANAVGAEVYRIGKDRIPDDIRAWMARHPIDSGLEDTLVVRMADGEMRYGGWKNGQPYVGLQKEVADKVRQEVREEAGEVNSLLDWDAVRPEIEKIYRVQLTDDDPLRMVADVVRIVLQQSQVGAVTALKGQVSSQLSDFNRDLDIALKARQQEGHTNILKMLAVAQGQLKLAGQEAQNEIRQETAELVSAAKELRSVNRSMRYYDWLVGFFFATLVLVVGVVVGLIYARSG